MPFTAKVFQPYIMMVSLTFSRVATMTDPYKYRSGRARLVRPVYASERIDIKNDVEVNYRYVNRTNRPVLITRRDGIRFVVYPHTLGNPSDEISIYVTLKGPLDVIKNTLDRLNDRYAPRGVEGDKWRASLERALYVAKEQATVVAATVEYMLSEHQIDNLGGRVYMTDQDIVIEWLDPVVQIVTHPFSQGELEKKSLEAVFTGCGEESFVMLFRAIDNSGQNYSDRYINIGGQVFKVPIEQDESLETGVYVTTRRSMSESRDDAPHELATHFMTFEKADRILRLQKTVEDALNGGPVTEVAKDRLNAHAASQKLEEARMRQQQLKMEEELQRIRHEREKEKLGREEKHSTQKIVLEWIKTAATLITAALSLYAAFRKAVPSG